MSMHAEVIHGPNVVFVVHAQNKANTTPQHGWTMKRVSKTGSWGQKKQGCGQGDLRKEAKNVHVGLDVTDNKRDREDGGSKGVGSTEIVRERTGMLTS